MFNNIFHSIPEAFDKNSKYVIVIGNLDGVHLGHQHIIDHAIKVANGRKLAVITFLPNPKQILQPDNWNGFILCNNDKYKKLNELYDIHSIVSLDSNSTISLSHKDFTNMIATYISSGSTVVVGKDFKFGYNALGDVSVLRASLEPYNIEVHDVDILHDNNLKISSSYIKTLLEQGDIRQANALLGSKFVISTEVVKGDQRARTINFHTLNMKPDDYIRLKLGVYATYCTINNKRYVSISNYGVRPTFKTNLEVVLETHIINHVIEEQYNALVSVEFVDYLRGECKFDGIDALKQQIMIDVNKRMTLEI